MKQGMIFNLERFAIHDGPGVRTLVFMKGCPLRCLWCSSPHSQKPVREMLYDANKCQRCGTCMNLCPREAVTVSPDDGAAFNAGCDLCGECVSHCPNQALEITGRLVSVAELFREIEKDSIIYRRSGGGVTIGGGEPTMQHEFVTEILKMCKSRFIHTAIETCGFTRWEPLQDMLEFLDLVMMDIKHMDDAKHRELTGVSNRPILENARRVAEQKPLILRIPVIPGLNDTEENIKQTAEFAAGLGKNLCRMDLLPYHQLGTMTYRRLGIDYPLEKENIEPPSGQQMKSLQNIVSDCGIAVQIGG